MDKIIKTIIKTLNFVLTRLLRFDWC